MAQGKGRSKEIEKMFVYGGCGNLERIGKGLCRGKGGGDGGGVVYGW